MADSLISTDNVFRSVAGWYVGLAKQTTRFAATLAGIPTPILSANADAVYDAAEATLINEIKAAVNSNNTLMTTIVNSVNQNSVAIKELQDSLKTIASIVGAAVAARNSQQYRGYLPALAAPTATDASNFTFQTATSSRVNTGETILTTANVGTIVLKWATSVGAPIFNVPTMVADVVYFADATGTVWAVRYFDGEVQTLWKYQADAIVLSSITVTTDACIVFDYTGCVHVLERATGAPRFKVRPNPHPAATFFGGQGTVDPVRGWVYFGVPSFQETLIALNEEGIFNGSGSLNGDSISAPASGAQIITVAAAPFTSADLYREITIVGATNASNNIRQGFIANVISATQILVLNTGGGAAEVFPASATYQITTPWARYILDLPNDPPLFSYPIGGTFISSVHALNPTTGKLEWTYYTINSSNFTAGTPGVTMVNGSLVVANLLGSTFGYPPNVPSAAGFNVYNPASRAQDFNGNARYAMGPSGGDVWGACHYDQATDRLFVPMGEQQAPPHVLATNGVLCLKASDGAKVWETQLSSDATLPDIWDDGLGTKGPNIKAAAIESISAPDADGFQTVTDTGAFVASDALSGRELTITGAAAQNNGSFAVAEFVDVNSIKILNPAGVVGAAVGNYALNRIYDADIGCTPMLVTTANATKYVVTGGKDGRIFVLNPTTGAIVTQKQLIQMGLLGGFQTAAAFKDDIVYLVGTNGAQVGRLSQINNVSLDIDKVGPAVVVACQIGNAGDVTKLWTASVYDEVGFNQTITTGPHMGTEFKGRLGLGVVVANNVVYFKPAGSLFLYAYNATTGAQLAAINTGMMSSSVPIVSNGKVIVPHGNYLPPNFRFPPEFNQLYGNIAVYGLPA